LVNLPFIVGYLVLHGLSTGFRKQIVSEFTSLFGRQLKVLTLEKVTKGLPYCLAIAVLRPLDEIYKHILISAKLLHQSLSDLLKVGCYLWQKMVQRVVAVVDELIESADCDDFPLRMIVATLTLLIATGIAELPATPFAEAKELDWIAVGLAASRCIFPFHKFKISRSEL
jgi:hypothetical protein